MLMDAARSCARMRTPMLFLAAEHDAYSPLAVLQGIVRGHAERQLFVKWGAGHSWNEAFIQDMQDQIWTVPDHAGAGGGLMRGVARV